MRPKTHQNDPKYDKQTLEIAVPAVRVDLDAEGLDVVRPVCAPREVREVELDLVPALVQAHRHRADERLDLRAA